MSGGFREVGGLSSPSRSGSVGPSSALATTEGRGERLGSLGRPSERRTALPLPKATAGGGTPSNRHGCHASLAEVPGPRPWVHTLSRREREGTPGVRGQHTRTTSGRCSAETAALLVVRASRVMARAWEQPLPCGFQGEPARFPREEHGASGAVPGLGFQYAWSSGLRRWAYSQDRVGVRAWRRGGSHSLTGAGRPPEAAGRSGGPGRFSGNPAQALAVPVQPFGTLADVQRGPGAGPPSRPAATS